MKWIKKHFNKILIACLTLISSIALFSSINNTYAYETNQFTYTVDTTDYTFTTINNKNGVLANINYDYFIIKLNNGTLDKNYDLLINFYLVDSNNNFITRDSSTLYLDVVNSSNQSIARGRYGSTSFNTNNMCTMVLNLSVFQQNPYFNYDMIKLLNFDTISTYKMLFVNIDLVKPSDIGLQQYYDTYYSQIEQNYNDLLSDYNELQNDYNTLQGNYNTLENNFNTLENNYNTLIHNYDSLNEFYSYGSWAYLNYLNAYDNLNNEYNANLQTLIDDTYFISNYIEVAKILNSESITMNNNYVDLSFNNLPISLIDFKFLDCNSNNLVITFSFLNTYNNSYVFKYLTSPNDFTFDSSYIISNYDEIDYNYVLVQISFNNVSNDYTTYKTSIGIDSINNAVYHNGYSNGYNTGVSDTTNSLQPQINDLQSQVDSLNSTNTQLQLVVNALNEQISSFDSSYNLNNLVWTIGSTPFESFKQIWNVNFFGVNIAEVITGFLTALIALYIIKKFFR